MNFDFRKKRTKLPELRPWGGGLGDSGNAWKKTFFCCWCLPSCFDILIILYSYMSVLIFVQGLEYHWQLHCFCFYCFPNLSKFGAAEKTKTTVQLSWMCLLIILAPYSSPNQITFVESTGGCCPRPLFIAWEGRQVGGYSTPFQIYEQRNDSTPFPCPRVEKRKHKSLCPCAWEYSVTAPQI